MCYFFQTPGYDTESNGYHHGAEGGRPEQIFTTLLRDQGKGLGFSIAGGKGADPYIEDSESVFISKIAESGPAARDGKLLVGDRLMQINGVDVSEAEHMKVVELLTGLERFVRLCVERNSIVATNGHSSTTNLFSQSSLSSLANAGDQPGKSPKVFGLPKPYTGLYSASSYMANRPSYMRSREPGQYTITSTSSSPGSGAGSNTTSYSKLPGVNAGAPGSDRKSFGTLPGSRTLPEIPRSSSTSTSLPRKSTSEDHSTAVANRGESDRSLVDPDNAVQALISRLPPAPTKPGVSTETVSRTSYTETTVRRVTDNRVKTSSAVEVSVAATFEIDT